MSRLLLLSFLLSIGLAVNCPGQEPSQAAEANANERYTVTRVDFPKNFLDQLTSSLSAEIEALKGKKYNDQKVRDIAKRAERQLQRPVKTLIEKGTEPETLTLTFQVERRRYLPNLDTSRTELLAYDSRLGWSGGLDVGLLNDPVLLRFGFKNNGERKLEREAGLLGTIGSRIVTERVLFRFDWENLRAQWNPATLTALEEQPDLPGIYRRHDIFAPSLAVRAAGPLTLQGGAEFNRLQFQYPQAHIEWANALFGEIRLDQRWEGNVARQRLRANYRLSSALEGLNSDFKYTQNRVDVTYNVRAGEQSFRAAFKAGILTGSAPLFARFNLGNLDTLRGWSQYDVAPVGGSRMAHGTLEYRYDWFWTWYDTGAVYDPGGPSPVRHAVGVGIRPGHGVELGVGFPIRSGSISPIFFVRVGR